MGAERPRLRTTILVLALLTAGCGDGGTEPAPAEPRRATTLTVTPATAELTALGASVQLSAQVLDQIGQAMAAAVVNWSSSGALAVTVDASGLVTAVANGQATITASAGGAAGTAMVTVAQAPDSVAVLPGEATIAALGDTLRLTAEAFDANGRAVAGAEFEWASSDDAVATVDGSGLVTAAGNGQATITASAGGASGTAMVTVAQAPDSVAVSPAEATIAALGDTLRLAAEAFDANGRAVAGAEFEWASSDDAVATVDGSGLVTAAGNGHATITASAGGAAGTAMVTVSSNQSPGAVATIPPQTLVVGDNATSLVMEAAFIDPDGHISSYFAVSADEKVARVAMSGATLSITPVVEGATIVTVTATDSGGLGATLAFPVTVERLAVRHHNVILRVVHVTTDWMPYASWSGWVHAVEPKESAALKYFEAAIWDETASVHLYEFDNDFNPRPGTDSAMIAYREQYAVRKHTGMPRDYGARQNFVKAAFEDFARYIADRFPDSDHHLLYSGHGGPGGRLFGGMLSREGAAEFLGTWRGLLGRRLGVIDMGGPCNKGGLSDLESFCTHARYYIASDLPNGGYDMDNWTIQKWDEVNVERQYHLLFARHRSLEDALVGRIDLKRTRYEYSRGDMTRNKVEQANYLYSCANMMSELGWNVRLFVEQSGGTYRYGRDLLQYLTEKDAPMLLLKMFDRTIIHQADNRDFFAWEEIANGIMLCCE